MKKRSIGVVVVTIAAGLAGASVTYWILNDKMQSRVMEVQEKAESIKDELFGYTKYTDYISAGKLVMTEQAKFLAAKVVRDYDVVEHLEAGRFGLKSNATVIVYYKVEYSFGYDLKPESYELQATPAGIEVKLGKPILVASPAVTPLKHEIPSSGLWTQEKDAIIAIHQRLPALARNNGISMAQDEAIRAVCEKRLVDFLRDFMGKQPGVKHVPAIVVVYK